MFLVAHLNPNPPPFSLRVKINLAVTPRRSEDTVVEVVTLNTTDPRAGVISLSPLVASSYPEQQLRVVKSH